MGLEELLHKAALTQDVDFLREGLQLLTEELLELQVNQYVGAERYERTAERTAQ